MPYPYVVGLCTALVILLGYFVVIRTTSFGIMRYLRWLLRNHVSGFIFGGFVAVVGIIGLIAMASVRSVESFQKNSALVAHSYDAINTINELRLDSANGSSTQRAALVVNTDVYKNTFETYRQKYSVDASKLENLVADNAVQQQRAVQIHKLLDERFNGWQAALQAREANGFDFDTVSNLLNDNAVTATKLRDLFAAMQQDEVRLLATRNTQFERSSRQTLLFLELATALSAILALAILTITTMERRSVARAQRQSRGLQAEQQKLLGELKQQTKNIAAQRVRDRAMLKSIGEGLIATDGYGYITSANPAALDLLGYSYRELIGKWYSKTVEAFDDEGQPIDPMDRPITQAIAKGEAVARGTNLSRKDGSVFPAFVTVSPVVLRGKPIGAIEVFRDITAERELDKAKDEFVSLASHQLRTPAAGVKAFASMLLDGYGGSLTSQQKEFLQQIYDSNERQLRIVDDLLSVARLDAGRMTLSRSPVDVADLIRTVEREMGPLVTARGQTLVVKIPKPLPILQADSDKLIMVLDNLLSNASKYTRVGGKITVRADIVGRRLQVAVTDTGVGITKADIPGLFQKFGRIENEKSAEVGGAGLGLYLAQQIARMHGGTISVISVSGKGSTFTLKLPLSRQLLYVQKKGSQST